MIQKKEKYFSKEMASAIKGIAISMMLFHHLYRSGIDAHEKYHIIYTPFPDTVVCNIATIFKICVGIFTLLSGYGLYLNYKESSLSPSKWILYREVKLLSNFSFIVICSWIICQLINGYPYALYFKDGTPLGFIYMFIELLGCSTLFGTPSLDAVWWYISAETVFIFLLPLIVSSENQIVSLLLGVISLPRVLGIGFLGGTAVYSFLFTFLLGVACAKYDFINRWIKKKSHYKIQKIITELAVLVLGYKLYHKLPISTLWELHYAFYPLLLILFTTEFIISLQGLDKIFHFLGKHSATIYFVHSLFLSYMSDFIYETPYFLISFGILLGLSLSCSFILELLKKAIQYEKMLNCLYEKIDNREPE